MASFSRDATSAIHTNDDQLFHREDVQRATPVGRLSCQTLGNYGESVVIPLKAILCLLLLAPLTSLATDNAELRSIKDADQSDRRSAPMPEQWREISRCDQERRERVLEILKSGQLTTAWDYFNAALVLQHGGSTEDIRLAHSLSTVAATIDPEHPSAKWLMAASWDRLMIRLNKPQWYGTQSTRDSSGKFVLAPVEPDTVSDADRAALGVPSLAEAQARLDARNSNE